MARSRPPEGRARSSGLHPTADLRAAMSAFLAWRSALPRTADATGRGPPRPVLTRRRHCISCRIALSPIRTGPVLPMSMPIVVTMSVALRVIIHDSSANGTSISQDLSWSTVGRSLGIKYAWEQPIFRPRDRVLENLGFEKLVSIQLGECSSSQFLTEITFLVVSHYWLQDITVSCA